MNAATTMRLAVWRELRSRWPLLLAGPLMLLLPPLLPGDWETGGWMFLTVVFWPLWTAALAGGANAAPDPFWRGLGGPEWARLLGGALVHLVVLSLGIVPYIGMHRHLPEWQTSEWLPDLLAAAGILWVLYASVFTARRLGAGLGVLSGPGVVAGVVGLCALLSAQIQHWPMPWGALVHAGLALLVGLVATLHIALRTTARHVGLDRGLRRSVPFAMFVTLSGSLLVEAWWPWANARRLYWPQADAGGEHAVWTEGVGNVGPSGHMRVWEWADGAFRRTNDRRVDEIELGPAGSTLLATTGTGLKWGQHWAELRTADGSRTSCSLDWIDDDPNLTVHRVRWRSDGRALILSANGRAMQLGPGCTPLNVPAEQVGWLGNTLVERRGDLLIVEGEELQAPVRGGEFYSVGPALYFAAGGSGAPKGVWQVTREGLREIQSPDVHGWLFEIPDGLCLRPGRGASWTCWDQEGRAHDLGRLGRAVDLHHVGRFDGTVGRVQTVEGQTRWNLPQGDIDLLRVRGDTLRVFHRGGFDDIGPDGTVTEHRIPAIDWSMPF